MKTFKEFAENKIDPYSYDIFDPRHPSNDPKEKMKMYQALFDIQDEWAAKSHIFRRILMSEIKDDPKERYDSTNHLKAKTRNALLQVPGAISWTFNEWENHLATNPFYKVN